MQLCEVALTIHGQIIDESQILLHQDMLHKFQLMTQHLEKIVSPSRKVMEKTFSATVFFCHFWVQLAYVPVCCQ